MAVTQNVHDSYLNKLSNKKQTSSNGKMKNCKETSQNTSFKNSLPVFINKMMQRVL